MQHYLCASLLSYRDNKRAEDGAKARREIQALSGMMRFHLRQKDGRRSLHQHFYLASFIIDSVPVTISGVDNDYKPCLPHSVSIGPGLPFEDL